MEWRRFFSITVSLVGAFAWKGAAVGEGPTPAVAAAGRARQLIRDPHFREGFRLIDPVPGQRKVYGRLGSAPGGSAPAWDLDQWSSRFPLAEAAAGPGQRRWSNAGKAVELGGPEGVDLTLSVEAAAEYGAEARKVGEPWVHLLAEQAFVRPPSLANLTSLRFHLEAHLVKARLHRSADYSPERHAAQFQCFLMVQNTRLGSPGFGKLLWFGIPIYDDRSRFPPAYRAQDFGGTAMFIDTPGGEVFTADSVHDGGWVVVDRELKPLLESACEAAWAAGFLLESRDWGDYRITGMNLGWEVPGRFEVSMEVRGLSLEAVEQP